MDEDVITSETGDSTLHPFRFAGGLDMDGWYKFGARYYDPANGRWTQKDPILFAGGDVNLYGYVMGDPVNWVDSSGFKKCKSYMERVVDNFYLTNAMVPGMALPMGVAGAISGKAMSKLLLDTSETTLTVLLRGGGGTFTAAGGFVSAGDILITGAFNGFVAAGAFEAGIIIGSLINGAIDMLLEPNDPNCNCMQ